MSFNLCSYIWVVGCPTEEGFGVFIVLGKGIGMALFMLMFLMLMISDIVYCTKLSYYGDKVSSEFDEPYSSEEGLLGDDFYQVFTFMVPMVSIFLFEVKGNSDMSVDYINLYSSKVSSLVSCKAFQWGWELSLSVFSSYSSKSLSLMGFYLEGLEYSYLSDWFVGEPKTNFGSVEEVFYVSPGLLFLSSKDVIHSFSIPSWGFKLDAVPGSVNFSIVEDGGGKFIVECAEFCGNGHPFMGVSMQSMLEDELYSISVESCFYEGLLVSKESVGLEKWEEYLGWSYSKVYEYKNAKSIKATGWKSHWGAMEMPSGLISESNWSKGYLPSEEDYDLYLGCSSISNKVKDSTLNYVTSNSTDSKKVGFLEWVEYKCSGKFKGEFVWFSFAVAFHYISTVSGDPLLWFKFGDKSSVETPAWGSCKISKWAECKSSDFFNGISSMFSVSHAYSGFPWDNYSKSELGFLYYNFENSILSSSYVGSSQAFTGLSSCFTFGSVSKYSSNLKLSNSSNLHWDLGSSASSNGDIWGDLVSFPMSKEVSKKVLTQKIQAIKDSWLGEVLSS